MCIDMRAVCVVRSVSKRNQQAVNIGAIFRDSCVHAFEPGTYNNGHTLSPATCGHLRVGDVVRVLIIKTEGTSRF